MPHAKEHPLAHRIVVPHGCLLTGETVRVIDWLDRCADATGVRIPPRSAVYVRVDRRRFLARWFGDQLLDPADAVAVIGRAPEGMQIVHASELPAYDPVPVGYVS